MLFIHKNSCNLTPPTGCKREEFASLLKLCSSDANSSHLHPVDGWEFCKTLDIFPDRSEFFGAAFKTHFSPYSA